MKEYTYFLILIASLAGPLALSFDRKVAFYKKIRFLIPAMLIAAFAYIVWDIIFTRLGVWSFAEDRVAGLYFFGLPIEEVLFFFVVPYCCMFIYECIKAYFPGIRCTRSSDIIMGILGLTLLVLGIMHLDKLYTGVTFISSAIGIGIVLLVRRFFKSFNSALFLVSYIVILIPFLIVNGFLTAIPVVTYNDAENLGIRITTIPAEDTVYGMLLFLLNVVIYEKLKEYQKINTYTHV